MSGVGADGVLLGTWGGRCDFTRFSRVLSSINEGKPVKLNQCFLFLAVSSVALCGGVANADDATITLDLTYSSGAGSAGTWQLLGRIDDTAGAANGQFGFSSVRALIDNIDFGSNGDAITFASGIGSINPIAENTIFERPAVLQQVGGTIDLVYGQDFSESETFPGSGVFRSVVSGVGNSGDALLASGSFAAGLVPVFGQDSTGPSTLFTQALFLTSASSPFVSAFDADNTFTLVTDNLISLTGDYNGNGVVDAADYTVWRDTFNSTTELAADGNNDGTVNDADYDVWTSHFGNNASVAVSVPEPSTLLLVLSMASMACLSNASLRK